MEVAAWALAEISYGKNSYLVSGLRRCTSQDYVKKIHDARTPVTTKKKKCRPDNKSHQNQCQPSMLVVLKPAKKAKTPRIHPLCMVYPGRKYSGSVAMQALKARAISK